jgi:hypothetical protein
VNQFRGDLRYQRDLKKIFSINRRGFWAEKTPFLPQIARICAEDLVNQFRGDLRYQRDLKKYSLQITRI